MRTGFSLMMILICFSSGSIHAQFGSSWKKPPVVVVISSENEERLSLVDEAIAFWNRTLEEMGSGFRLPKATRVKKTIPESELQALSLSVVGNSGPARTSAIGELPGDLNIFLANSEFVSFASPFDADGKRVVGIRGTKFPPLTMPNVARNVIVHEIGHAIGLGHNSDPAMLMCGRPAPCRPALFASPEAKIFPLTADEKRQLAQMYSAAWKPKNNL